MCIENDLSQIKEKINEIEEKSGDGGYIFRGERQCNDKVSSNLYRDFDGIDGFNIEKIQKEMLNGAKKHTGHHPLTGDLPKDYRQSMAKFFNVDEEDTAEAIDFEILTEIQHYGGKTNLIDFTIDYLVALFFACDGHHDKDGRVILQKADEIQGMIKYPRNPRHRVAGQKSVFVRHPKGFIEPHKDNIVIIPASLKKLILQHLRKYHGIFTETIYNDVYGFIRSQDIHGDAYTQFYRGLTCQNRADVATTTEVKQQEYENAIKHYTESIKSKPDYTATYNNRGLAYFHIGDYNRAIEDYDKAIEIQPDFVNAYNGRGTVYGIKGELDNAITDFDKAIELKPDYVDAYNNRGNAYYKKGELDNAITDFDKAIELKPDYVKAYYNRGNTYYKKGELDNAITDFDKAIELKPDYVDTYNNRGTVYGIKGELDNAITDFDKAIELKPDYVKAYKGRGFVYTKKGEYNRAIEDYDKAIEIQPDDAQVYYNCGEARLHLNEMEKAKADLITAKEMGVDIVAAFRIDYESVTDFEQKTGIQLPEDISAMLTPPQA